MELVIKNDYTIHEDLKEELKYIREIQLDVLPQFRSDLEDIMAFLGRLYFIYQYNTNDRKVYDYFAWSSEDKRTVILTFNNDKNIRHIISSMENLLSKITNFRNKSVKVWVKMNNIKKLIKECEESENI